MAAQKRIACDIELNEEFVLKELIYDTEYTPEGNAINLYTGDNDFSIGCNWNVKREVCDGKWAIWVIKYNFKIKFLKTSAMQNRQIACEHIFHKKISDKWKKDFSNSTDVFKEAIDDKLREYESFTGVLSCGYCHIAEIHY